MLLQPFRNGERILAMARHAQRQRLAAREDEEGVERRDRRAEVAQAHDARGDGEGEVAERLGELHAVVGRVRLDQRLVAVLGAQPIERAAIDDDAADRVAVPADELGQRVHDDVGAVLLRLAQVRRRQRVIDDERHAGLLGDGGDGRQVDEDAARVGDRLAEDRPRLRRDRLGERGGIGRRPPRRRSN